MPKNLTFPIAALGLLAMAGCGHPGNISTVAPIQEQAYGASADEEIKEARKLIRERLEVEILQYRAKIDTLRILTPAFEGEYVFVANITMTEGPSPMPRRARIIGSAYLRPERTVYIWKERPL